MSSVSIKFSHLYRKLATAFEEEPPEHATLLQVLKVKKSELSQLFIQYDSLYYEEEEAKFYSIPDGDLILLLFLSEKGQLFSTLRSYNDEKWKYYSGLVTKHFDVLVSVE